MKSYLSIGLTLLAFSELQASHRLTPEQMADISHAQKQKDNNFRGKQVKARLDKEEGQHNQRIDEIRASVFYIRNLVNDKAKKVTIESALTQFAQQFRDYPNDGSPFSKTIHTLICAADHLQEMDVTKIEFEGLLFKDKAQTDPMFPTGVKLPTS